MLTHIGTRTIADDTLGLLLECHGRIRAFTELAARLASAEGASEAEVAEVATAVRRYFAEAFPLHALDEEESILPRLAGRDRQVDAALVTMHREHAGQDVPITRVVALCTELATSPGRHGELAQALGRAAAVLREHFARHLALEEEVIFPALQALVADPARTEIVGELRARRAHSSR
jgi:iron-sulfur cluster repair protein YtfE (RIC family)